MQSLWFVRQGRVEWRDVPAPTLGGDQEALVQPIAASTCDLDRFVLTNPSPFTKPFAMGHNGIGRVLEIGDAVSSVKPGDLVAITWHINCGHCRRCNRGLLAHCSESAPGTSYGLPGGDFWGGLFDDLVRVPYADAMLHKLPDHVDPVEFVAASDNLSLGYSLVAPHIKTGYERVLIMGWGINGLYSTAFANALGARDIVYVDDDASNLEMAAKIGATAIAGGPTRDMGSFDLVVDTSSDPKWLKTALKILEPEGMIECAAHITDVTLEGWEWYRKSATLHCGLVNIGPQISRVFEAVEQGAVTPSRLWSKRVAWDENLPAACIDLGRQLVAVRADY